jgi:hypothetical protein
MALLYSMVFSIHGCGKYKCLSSTLINYVFFKKKSNGKYIILYKYKKWKRYERKFRKNKDVLEVHSTRTQSLK